VGEIEIGEHGAAVGIVQRRALAARVRRPDRHPARLNRAAHVVRTIAEQALGPIAEVPESKSRWVREGPMPMQLDGPGLVPLSGGKAAYLVVLLHGVAANGNDANLAWSPSSESVEGYNIVFGGGSGSSSAIGREVFKGISFSEIPQLLERALHVYLQRRQAGESFSAFTRRHEIKQLQEMFSQ
jgi:hypothetical protein